MCVCELGANKRETVYALSRLPSNVSHLIWQVQQAKRGKLHGAE